VTSQFHLNRILWLVAAALTIPAALIGIVSPGVDEGLVSAATEPGVFTQDIFALTGALALVLLAVITRERQLKRRTVAHGIPGAGILGPIAA